MPISLLKMSLNLDSYGDFGKADKMKRHCWFPAVFLLLIENILLSYVDAFPVEKAFQILEESSGLHFDPVIVGAFLSIRDEIEMIRNAHQVWYGSWQNPVCCVWHQWCRQLCGGSDRHCFRKVRAGRTGISLLKAAF